MPRTGGEKTKEKILLVAEELFSEKGFDKTSVDLIAKTAGVNKALIYYHFKDKSDLIRSLFANIVEELRRKVDKTVDNEQVPIKNIREKIRYEIKYLRERKKIISLMFMESFKSSDENNFLFKISDIVIRNEYNTHLKMLEGKGDSKNIEKKYFMFEFFTGFIPLLSFVAFEDKWCNFFSCDSDTALEYFLDSFEKTHLQAHSKI